MDTVDHDTPIPAEMAALLDAFAARREAEPSVRPTAHQPRHGPLAWQTLVTSDIAVTRATLDHDGALLVQCLSAVKRLRGTIHIPPEAVPVLRALLDGTDKKEERPCGP